jgi:hypothetical protein
MSRQNKFDKAVEECYTRMYKEATPSADFKQLMEEAELDSEGRKIIRYMDYTLSMESQDKILEEVCKANKLTERDIDSVSFEVYLGVSPSFGE